MFRVRALGFKGSRALRRVLLEFWGFGFGVWGLPLQDYRVGV